MKTLKDMGGVPVPGAPGKRTMGIPKRKRTVSFKKDEEKEDIEFTPKSKSMADKLDKADRRRSLFPVGMIDPKLKGAERIAGILFAYKVSPEDMGAFLQSRFYHGNMFNEDTILSAFDRWVQDLNRT